jgi:protein arginine kinase activator
MNETSDLSNSSDDRPLECGECKKPIAVRYTLVIGNTITHTVMCQDCPVLQRRLFGSMHTTMQTLSEGGADIACGNCGTTLDAVRMGAALGCKTCYEVFEEVILAELQIAKKISPRISLTKKSAPIHIGKSPGESLEINPAMRLLALNEALSETLQREDYEQAALLRDQIKELTEDSEKEKNDGN